MAYKRKFENRSEAYRYTDRRISTVKDPTALLKNYTNSISGLCPVVPKRTELVSCGTVYKAFDVSVGTAPYNVIIIHEDGEISI